MKSKRGYIVFWTSFLEINQSINQSLFVLTLAKEKN